MLPIYEIEPDLIHTLQTGNRLIVTAPTGSGKSTQVPQMLVDRKLVGNGRVVILQPRRIAARLLARRVAQERHMPIGSEVGYQVRFEKVSSAGTRILYVTEGVLLRHLLSNPTLQGIDAILFDEFHERHLDGDIMLARALDLQELQRPDLKLIVMSATLDVDLVQQFLDPCEIICSEGRTHPVDIEYLDRPWKKEKDRVWEVAAKAFNRLVQPDVPGDVLVFMPGAYEIRRTIDAIRATPAAKGCTLLPLHGELSPRDQDAAVDSYVQRKIVVSTNVAETSLTIDGIRIVIDAGLARMPRFDPYRGINTLYIEKISRASADQRAGRAGRTAPGRCLRLWTEREQKERPRKELPEIKRLDLSEVILTLKAAGVADLNAFRWLEAPDPVSLERAHRLLVDLGALDPSNDALTDIGRRMVGFPLHPRYSRMLLAASDQGCVREAALIAALSQGRTILLRAQGKPVEARREERLYRDDDRSDFFPLMRAWEEAASNRFRLQDCADLGIHAQSARQVEPLRDQVLRIADRGDLVINRHAAREEDVRKCVLAGFIDQLAARRDKGTMRCEVIHGRRGVLSKESRCKDTELLVASEVHEIEHGKGPLKVELSLATAVEEEWLRELFPEDFVEGDVVALDETGRRVVACRQRKFRDLILDEKALPDPPADQASALLAQEVIAGNLKLKKWNEAVDQWIHRLNGLSEWCPELQLPAIRGEDRLFLVQQICDGCTRYKELKDKPVWPVLKSWLLPGQAGVIDTYAPERIPLPSGRKARIRYAPDAPPTLSARIQDLYGVKRSLCIAMDRVPLRIEILAPNHRPVQVTDNLETFWEETYPKVKKELQRKYPKHEWR